MHKTKLRLLLAALTGVAVFISIILLEDIPARIATGNQAQLAIQMLDSIRPPMLAIEKAESPRSRKNPQPAFEQSAAELRKRIAAYLEASRYNETLHRHVVHFSSKVEDWLADEKRLRQKRGLLNVDSIDALKNIEQLHEAAVEKFLQSLEVLALGEHPVHQDIDHGREANYTLQILSVILILYLLTLIIIFQVIRKRELLDTFLQVQEARRDLAQREEYLSLTLNSIGDAVIATDAKGLVTRMNPIAEQLTGWPASSAREQPLKKIFHIVNAMTREIVADPVEKVLQSGQIVGLANHTVLISKDNTEYQIADSGAPIRGDDGGILGVILVFRDITEEYRMQTEILTHRDELEQRVAARTRELERSNRELETFSYAVSHDLRAPLRSINGFSEALLEDNSPQLDDSGKDYLKRIAAAAVHMGELIDAMLVLSRVTRQGIRHTRVDLSGIANSIIEELQERDSSRQVEWVIKDGLHAEGDADLLHIVLENLLENAWKYSSKNTEKIRIEFGETEQDGQQVFYVRDNGCGFNTNYSDKLFAAFQRLHGKDYEGTGIGLATVNRIILRHEGKVWAESTLNEGSCFYFTLQQGAD